MYKLLPTTRELVGKLKRPKASTKEAKWNRVLLIVMLFGAIVIAVAWAMVKWWDWMPTRPTGYVAISAIGVVLFAWLISVVIDGIQIIKIAANPAGDLADQFDCDTAMEKELLWNFRAIPAHVLQTRHLRLEWQLLVWDKWLDAARLTGLLGPPFIFVAKGIFGSLGVAIVPLNIEILVSAALTGVFIGALSMRSGMRRLHRVSYLLKRASEQQKYRPRERRVGQRR